MPVITIGRQYGAGGETVGQMVAQRLGAELVDRQIFTEVARRLEMPDSEVEEQDERPGGFLHRLLTALGAASVEFSAPPEVSAWTPPYSDPAFDLRRAALTITQEVIREAARTGNAVIVGRSSAYILREHPGALHVFLRASEEARLETARQLTGGSLEEARRKLRQTDANRSAYIRQLYGHYWLQPSHYDLVLDTGRLGYERAVDTIVAAVGTR